MKNIVLTTIMIVLIVESANANPVMVDLYGVSGDGALWMGIASSALLIEFLAVRWFLRKWVKLSHVLSAFILINLITFPLTQILGTVFIWLAEILPLALEPVLYRRFCRKIGVEVPRLGMRIIAANLISFLIGVAWYTGIALLKGLY